MNTFIINSADLQHLNERDAIIRIQTDITLPSSTTLGANSVLVFENGAMINANSEVTLTGSSTTIEAPLVQILGNNVHLDGTFVNAEWPAEWWGAKSEYIPSKQTENLDMSGFINRALQEIANTGRQGTLLLTGRYEVHDTIYMQPGVAISGAARTYTYNLYEGTSTRNSRPTRGTLLVKFNNPNRWVIDTKDQLGNELPYNKLYADYNNFDNRFYSHYVGCNITNLCIKDWKKNDYTHVFGGIRLHSMQSGKIEDMDINVHAFIGLALITKVWDTKLSNLHINVVGCALYLGRTCTTLTAINVSCRADLMNDQGPFRLTQPSASSAFVTPLLLDHSLPPYLSTTYEGSENDDHYHMQSCDIIMEGAHCTFYSCTLERADAVICGTNYTAKFISPYIEKIYLTCGWLYSTKNYAIPNYRHELIIEDMTHGFDIFPASDKIIWKNYMDVITAPDGPLQPAGSVNAPMTMTEQEAYTSSTVYCDSVPTFGTVRGVIKAHDVGRATCWEDDGENAETWNYPSYFIHVTPGTNQRSFYYDRYRIVKETRTNDATGEIIEKRTWLEGVKRCRYKRIILGREEIDVVRYWYDESNDVISPGDKTTSDNKAEWDIYKRRLMLGTNRNAVTQARELFARGLNHFVMTPTYYNSLIDYDGVVMRKRFTIEVIDNARNISFGEQLKLHDCEVTFKNTHTANTIFNRSGNHDLLGVSGDCTLNFEGAFLIWNNLPGSFIGLLGNVHVNLTINLLCTTFPAPETYVDEQGVPHSYAQINLNTLFSSSAFISHLASFTHGCTLTINCLQTDGHITRTVQEITYSPDSNS